jgi:polysaccharide export outer membrane protein
VLQPGDIVNIPALNDFFIGGEVNAPGSFPLKEGTSLRQAVTLAQGTTFKAAKNRAVIFRGNVEDGKQLEIPVDIDAVMSGKKPDVLLQADDLVVVPSSRMKAIGGTVLQAFGMSTVQRGVLRY